MSIKFCSCTILDKDFVAHDFLIHSSNYVSYSISNKYSIYDFLGFTPLYRDVLIAYDSDISFSSIEYLCSILKCSYPMNVYDPQLYFHNHIRLKFDIIGISKRLNEKLFYYGGIK